VTTEKEFTAFVERVAKRASVRASHRAAFVGVRPLVERSLGAGHSMKATWEVLHAEGTVTMTYETFRAHCRQAGLGRAAPQASSGRTATTERHPPLASRPQPIPAQERPGEGSRGFQHNRVPRKDRIY
jgi:hypothetical protein